MRASGYFVMPDHASPRLTCSAGDNGGTRWTASAKWAEGPAFDGQCDMRLARRMSEGFSHARREAGAAARVERIALTKKD